MKHRQHPISGRTLRTLSRGLEAMGMTLGMAAFEIVTIGITLAIMNYFDGRAARK
jgi:hypothetical protein